MEVHPIILVPMPCGCVIDPLTAELSIDLDVARCPWCEAIFLRTDLIAWLECGAVPPVRMQGALSLVTSGENVFEVVGRARCGCPEVRERVYGATTFHLDLDEVTAWLRD